MLRLLLRGPGSGRYRDGDGSVAQRVDLGGYASTSLLAAAVTLQASECQSYRFLHALNGALVAQVGIHSLERWRCQNRNGKHRFNSALPTDPYVGFARLAWHVGGYSYLDRRSQDGYIAGRER